MNKSGLVRSLCWKNSYLLNRRGKQSLTVEYEHIAKAVFDPVQNKNAISIFFDLYLNISNFKILGNFTIWL